MTDLETAARNFLGHKRIAVAGVSRGGDVAANVIYRRLRTLGYDVVPVNPSATEVEGSACFPTVAAIDPPVGAVVIATHPDVSEEVVRDCARAGVREVWIHRGIGLGSFSDAAIDAARELGLQVIPGSCPMMFCEPVDGAHKCLRWLLRVSGKEGQIEQRMRTSA